MAVLFIGESGSGSDLNPSTNSLPFIRAEAVQARVSQLKFHLPPFIADRASHGRPESET